MPEQTALKKRAQHIDRWIIVVAILGVITVVVSVWIAFTVDVQTTIDQDESGAIVIEGREAPFVGTMRGTHEKGILEIRGLPDPAVIAKDPAVRYAICAARDNPDTVWEEPSATLRAHLHSEAFNELCDVYPNL